MNDLDELKSLLFGAEKQVLDSIKDRVQKPETRTADVADVLSEAVWLSHRQGPDLVKNLREPVGQCLKESFRDSPQEYADALYPVMGPAIRKSITQTLRAFAQQINETIEQSLSARGMKWRFEAWRAGVPFGDYVVQKTLLYRIEQAYLISRENGLLVSHVHHNASRIKDSDAVSAMFTAIQDFVKESFSPDRSGRLETADMGEFTLWAVHGPHALLVCVIRGVPPRSLRTDLSAILERIHFRYGDKIRKYTGDTESMQGVDEELVECLKLEAQQPRKNGKRKLSTPIILMALVVLTAIGYFTVGYLLAARDQRNLTAVLDQSPGYFISTIDREGRHYFVHGLRDPLASSIEQIANLAGLNLSQISADLRPYQSLDPQILLLRARKRLKVPSTVSVEVNDQFLQLSGTATQNWIQFAQEQARSGSLGFELDFSELISSDVMALQARAAELSEAEFLFSSGAELTDRDKQKLLQYAATAGQLATDAKQLGNFIFVSVIGHTDNLGSEPFNKRLAERRADVAAKALTDAGISPQAISRSSALHTVESDTPVPQLRKVSVLVTLRSSDERDTVFPE